MIGGLRVSYDSNQKLFLPFWPFVVWPFVALLTLCRLTLCRLTLCRLTFFGESFMNVFTNRLLRWFRLIISNKLKITCIFGFSATNSHLRWSVLILSKSAFSKCCLNTVVFTAWFVFHENVEPLLYISGAEEQCRN